MNPCSLLSIQPVFYWGAPHFRHQINDHPENRIKEPDLFHLDEKDDTLKTFWRKGKVLSSNHIAKSPDGHIPNKSGKTGRRVPTRVTVGIDMPLSVSEIFS